MRASRFAIAAATAGLLFAGLAGSAHAAPKKGDPPCIINPSPVTVGQTYVVSASGIPTDTAINLVVTNANGTTGSPLGSTPDGTFHLGESSPVAGTTSYAFTGPVKTNGTTVYSTCSVQVS
jgi:hypothetical protein